MIVLKIGGSVITDKGGEEVLRESELRRVAKEIAENPVNLVLVHGAGSFGHPQARRWINSGFDPRGILETHQSVAKLNNFFVEALVDEGVDAMPIHPLGFAVLDNGRITVFHLDTVREMIQRGVVPVFHGDVVMDRHQGAAILSGDQICVYLAECLGSRLGVGTNVDGIMIGGQVVPRLSRDVFDVIKAEVSVSQGVDVTGGMLGKVQELLSLSDKGISAQIFNASTAGNVSRFLRGEEFGTRIGGMG